MSDEDKELTVHDYEMALLSQGAVNLSGLAHELSRVMPKIWAQSRAQGKGTEFVNTHPIVRLYLEQMMFLCARDYSEAYAICTKIVECQKRTKEEAHVRSDSDSA